MVSKYFLNQADSKLKPCNHAYINSQFSQAISTFLVFLLFMSYFTWLNPWLSVHYDVIFLVALIGCFDCYQSVFCFYDSQVLKMPPYENNYIWNS